MRPVVVIFLSCLFGSELRLNGDDAFGIFLSCLFGSELERFQQVPVWAFLSCLFGSERRFC